MNPTVLIDIDGVCVQWQSGLPYFMAKHSLPTGPALASLLNEKFVSAEELFGMDNELSMLYLKEYNKSKFIKYLAPYSDALEFVNTMKHKWNFVAVTALGTDKETVMNRVFNLNSLFPGAFKDIFVCGAGESKDEILSRAKDKYPDIIMFIDDLAENLESASRVIPEVPRYHMVRGERATPKCHHIKLQDLKTLIKYEK